MSVLDKMQKSAFLGSEFLTWLWYRCEQQDGIFDIGLAGGPFEVWFDDRLTVGSNLVDAQENLFKGGHPTSSLEARSALRLGKLATEARLRFIRGAQEWAFTFKAADLGIAGLKLPTLLGKEDDERFYERMLLLEQLEAAMKGLFIAFMKQRLDPDWGQGELRQIQQWVGHGETHAMASSRPLPVEPESVEEPADEAPLPQADAERPPWEDPILGTEE